MTVRELINALIDAEDKDAEVVVTAAPLRDHLKIREVKSDRWSATLEVDFDSGDLELDKLDLQDKT